MKTLVVYNSKGNIIFTQTNATDSYNLIVEDVADGKEVVGVDVKNNKLILADKQATTEQLRAKEAELESTKAELSNEKKESANRYKELEFKNKELELQENKNLELQDEIIELKAQQLI